MTNTSKGQDSVQVSLDEGKGMYWKEAKSKREA